jgi:hypothetical protein
MTDFGRLRRAREHLEPERLIEVLDSVLRTWSAPHSLWRERLRRDHPVFSPEVVELGTRLGTQGWTGDVLRSLRAREVPEPSLAPELTAVWLAGSIPTASFSATLLPLLAGSAVYVKPSSADPVSPRLFADSLRAVDPELALAVALGEDSKALELADAVVVYGRDETVAELREAVSVQRPFVGYGHKLSVAAVGAESELEPAAEALGLDAALYDGRGCLSPAFAFVEDRPQGRAEAFAAAFAAVLGRLETELPRGRLGPDEQTQLHEVRSSLAMREGVRLWRSQGSLSWTVILSRFEGIPPIPGALRTVPVVPIDDEQSLEGWLASLRPHLSCVGQTGWGSRLAVLSRAALRAGGSRVCPLGKMQLPPLDWRHDGMGPIRPLLRVLDVEEKEDR